MSTQSQTKEKCYFNIECERSFVDLRVPAKR